MDDKTLMPFGKFKGEKLANVPDSYLLWLHKEGKLYGEFKRYVEDNLDAIDSNIQQTRK